MDVKEILKHVDHTLLLQPSTWEEIKQICDDAMEYGTASVCIPPSYVKQAAEYMNGQMAVCTVIGFPNGYMTTAAKEFETKDALANGASEIDMVINLDDVKSRRMHRVLAEISALRKVCEQAVLKVIVETCSLTQEEKRELAGIVEAAGADYIKTSTGFGAAGAQLEDVRLFHELLDGRVKIKAAGGIRTLAQMQDFLAAGAERIGSSADLAALAAEETAGQQS